MDDAFPTSSRPPGGALAGGWTLYPPLSLQTGDALPMATGAAVAYALEHELSLRPRRIVVVLDGGELEVEVEVELQVNLTGWARPVFAGHLSEEFEKELHETE